MVAGPEETFEAEKCVLLNEKMKKSSITASEAFEMPEKLGKEEIEEEEVEEDHETCWRSVYVAGIVGFLAAVENTVVGMGEWPYMHTIDPEARSNFFGLASSASKTGKIIFSLVFSYWTFKTHKVIPPLIAGRILAFIGCCLYLCVEFLPEGRRYLMMVCYVIFGIAASSSAVLRVYLVAVSAIEDRTKAFAAIALANTLSIVVGPVCQLLFSKIKYPGYTVLPNIHFHLYSAPVWIATFLNFISIAVICSFLEEKLKPKGKEIEESSFSFAALKEKFNTLRALKVCWLLVFLCCIEKFIVALTPATLITIGSPFKMTVFGWDGSQTVMYTSGSLAICGLLAITVAYLFMKSNFFKNIPTRYVFLFGISISMGLYLGTYPVNLWGGPIPKYNATTGSGCNPKEYSWCDTAVKSQPYIYFPVMILTLGLAIPLLHISLDTVYSRVLGNIDQTMMQGVIVAVEDLVMIIGPIWSSFMFTHSGQAPLWIVNGIITLVGIGLWVPNLKKLKKFQ